MITLTPAQLKIVHDECLLRFPEEAVIAITADDAIPLKNLHQDPINYFSINEMEFDDLDPIALIHSHTYKADEPRHPGEYVDARIPSKMDMIAQGAVDLPFGIIATDGLECTDILWFPDLDSPIEGRDYVSNVFDCYRVVRAYHWQVHGVYVPENPREYKWWKENVQEVMRFADFGFHSITEEQLKEGDVIIFRMGNNPNHLGIYLGNGEYVHHLTGKLSKKDDYSRDRHLAVHWLRHKDMEHKINE